MAEEKKGTGKKKSDDGSRKVPKEIKSGSGKPASEKKKPQAKKGSTTRETKKSKEPAKKESGKSGKTEKKTTGSKKTTEKKPQEGGKIKPRLDERTRKMLKKREERKHKQPRFLRNEWFRYGRLENKWKRPRGVTNKMRLNRKYRPPKVTIGYGKPAEVRGLHSSGFREVLVHNPNDIEGIDPKLQAIRIGATVGTRKRKAIIEEADRKKIRVLNRGAL